MLPNEVFQQRRAKLLNLIKERQGSIDGSVVFWNNFEPEGRRFISDASFYYFTGCHEPGAVLVIAADGEATLYVPHTGGVRSKWVCGAIEPESETAKQCAVDKVVYLGKPITGVTFFPFFTAQDYEQLIGRLQKEKTIFSIQANDARCVEPQFALERFMKMLPTVTVINIMPLVAQLRKKKDTYELDLLYQAITITDMAQEAAASLISPDTLESDVQAAIEYVFTSAGALPAFPSIVGGGKNATVLHYADNNHLLENGLVVVDIGARFGMYCADITRTYPVKGMFSEREKELYELVQRAQEHIAAVAQPGMWLANKEKPEASLLHLAQQFFRDNGNYDSYFIHGLGHYLGIDVHDVGSYQEPLAPGEVITIEPGLYLPEEQLGVRIEDNYVVTKDGVLSLSEQIPKDPQAVVARMQQTEALI